MNEKEELHINLFLSGEYLYFLKYVMSQTGMSHTEVLTKMMELYKIVYLSENEFALVQGDLILTKFNTENLKRKTTDL